MELKKTPLFDEHRLAGAKMIDFGGWEMPVQYVGVLDEHRNVRSNAGLFDVSHMGEIEVKGKDALDFLQYMVTNDVTKIQDNQILYTPMCSPDGGVIDDFLIYRFNQEHFLLVVNASNTEKDFAWLQENSKHYEVRLENNSDEYALLALQGPKAQKILQKLTSLDLNEIKPYWFKHWEVDEVVCMISRTGYTGEDGFEIYFSPQYAVQLWKKILEVGAEEGIQPIGLGARDTLRFEAKLPLYGNELGPEITPLEAGLGFFVKLEKENFIGKEALQKQKEDGLPRKLVGLEMIERGIARSQYPIQSEGKEIGFVTSGSFAPTLNKNIALGLIATEYAEEGKTLDIMIRGKAVKAQINKSLFYKRK
ncbi:MAG: glycine cleavage system aminomethyltransferase GcvT [Desulfitobacterium sp.]|nr:glycine cleavage system aminomethyltransferase GcvT [Desulfitobacterium sp.]